VPTDVGQLFSQGTLITHQFRVDLTEFKKMPTAVTFFAVNSHS